MALVGTAGSMWGTGPLFVKLSVHPSQFILKYLVVRMITLSILYSLYITFRRRRPCCCYRSGRHLDSSPDSHPTSATSATSATTTSTTNLSSLLLLREMKRKWSFSGILGIACAMSGFVISLAYVPAANTLCQLAAIPFFAASIERLLLQVSISWLTLGCMCLAAVGLLLFAFEGEDDTGSSGSLNAALYKPILGNILGVVSALGFSVYAVALTVIPTQRKEDGMYGVVISFWGAITVIVGAMLGIGIREMMDSKDHSSMHISNDTVYNTTMTRSPSPALLQMLSLQQHAPMNPFDMPLVNVWLSAGHAAFIFVGFILYTLGSSHLPAPETVLLSMMEVVGGVLLTYIFVGEYPGTMGIIGTILTTLAVVINGVGNGVLEKKSTCIEEREEEEEGGDGGDGGDGRDRDGGEGGKESRAWRSRAGRSRA